jgi:putative tricarboxylic transport membrane protein
MKRADVIACLLWMALGTALWMGALRLDLGSPSDPGSGFLPFGTGILISLLGFVQLGVLFFGKARDDDHAAISVAADRKRPAWVVVILALYGLSLSHLGYLVATFFAMLGLFSIYGRRRWGLASAGSLLVTIITYVVFHELLSVQLPAGLLKFGG